MGKGTGFFTPRYDVKPPAHGASATANPVADNGPDHVVNVPGSVACAGHAARKGPAAQHSPHNKALSRSSVPPCMNQWQLEGSSPPTSNRSLTSHRSAGRHSFPARRTASSPGSDPVSSAGNAGLCSPATHSHASRAFSWQAASMSLTGGTSSDQLLTCSSIADSHSLLAKNGAVMLSETCVSSWDEQHASWAAPATSFNSNSSSREAPAVCSLSPTALQSTRSMGPGSSDTAAALQRLGVSDSSNGSLRGVANSGQRSVVPHASQVSHTSQGVKEEVPSLCTAADMIIPVTASIVDPALQPSWHVSPSTLQQASYTHLQHAAGPGEDITLDDLLALSAQLVAAKTAGGSCASLGVCGSPSGSLPADLSPIGSSVFNSDQVLPHPYGLPWQQLPAVTTAALATSTPHSDDSLSPGLLRLLPLQQQLSGQQQVLASTTALLSRELFGYGAAAAPSLSETQLGLQAHTLASLGPSDTCSSGFNTLVGSHNDLVTLSPQQVTFHSGQYAVSPGFSPAVNAAPAGGQCVVGNEVATAAAAVVHDKLAQMQRLEALQAQLRQEVAGLLTLI